MPEQKARAWLKLTRLQAGAATAITGVFGAILLMPRGSISTLHLLFIFIIGLLYHFYGFVLNEYADVELDRFADVLFVKPLVKGSIKEEHALFAAFSGILLAFTLAVFVFRNNYANIALLGAIILGAVYDLWGKRFFGADFVLGGSIFLFTLFGALTVSSKLTWTVFLVAFLFFIQLSFQTGVTGGIKDIPHDKLAGARTSPVFLGCKVVGKRLVITREFKIYVIVTKTIHTTAIIIPFMVNWFILYNPVFIQVFAIAVLLFAMWFFALKVISEKEFERARLMRMLGGHEIVTYPMVAILIMGYVGVQIAVFLMLFPILWYLIFLFIIYGRAMPEV